MTAFQIMMLSGLGLPLIPIGGSDDNRLKSRISRRLEAVDWKSEKQYTHRGTYHDELVSSWGRKS